MTQNLAVATAEPSIETVLSGNILMIILSRLEFADLYQLSRLSKTFCKLAGQDIRAPYGIQHKGKAYLDYTKIPYEMDRLLQAAGKDRSAA